MKNSSKCILLERFRLSLPGAVITSNLRSMSEARKPQLWSDFDGTAVETVAWFNPRNWSKNNLAGIDGYKEFLEGAAKGELDVRGVVSRRPNIGQRHRATQRAIYQLGLEAVFDGNVILAGSEENKGNFIAKQSQDGKIAVIDDKPHRLVPAILAGLSQIAERPNTLDDQQQIGDTSPLHVVLGVVNHEKTAHYFNRMLRETSVPSHASPRYSSQGVITFSERRFSLNVVRLAPYSNDAGLEFAQTVIDARP
jgi:hypothetical protein